MITSVFLSLVYILFPLCIYFLYLVYSKVIFKKEKSLFLDFALFSSYYICSRFGNIPIALSFLINIPLLIAVYKNRTITSIILALLTAAYMTNVYNLSIAPFLIEYGLILIISYFTKYKKEQVFSITIILSTIYNIIFENIIDIKFGNIYFLVLIWISMYITYYVVILSYNKIDMVVNMYHSLEEITKEKTLYQSLFKITHEIKNPLAVCKGYLDMFDIKDVGKANKYVGIINQEIDRTLELLKDFSDVSKINIQKNLMDANMLIEDVCDEADIILNKDINFKYYIDDNSIEINGDYDRLKQVLINVIKNSKEAVKGTNGLIELNAHKKGKYYVITVSDNGVGMEKETKEKIGTPFYTTKKNGTGLGVCFSKEIIEKHGGSMKYNSILGKGTTVEIKLPI